MPITPTNPKITPNSHKKHSLSLFIVISIIIILIGTFIGSFVYKKYVNDKFNLDQNSQKSTPNPDDEYKVKKQPLPFKTQDIADNKQVFTLSDQSEFSIEYPKDWKVETRSEDVTKANGQDNLTDKFIIMTKESLKYQVNFANTANPILGIANCYLQGEHKLIANDKYAMMVNTDPEGKISSNFGNVEPLENYITKDYSESITANEINKSKDKAKITFCQNQTAKQLKKTGGDFVNIDVSKEVENLSEDEIKSFLDITMNIKGVALE